LGLPNREEVTPQGLSRRPKGVPVLSNILVVVSALAVGVFWHSLISVWLLRKRR
jgi:hypothetical protein